MKIHIIGANGSMGKRYQAILKNLGMSFSTSDLHTTTEELASFTDKASGIIISTPTHTHFDFINRFATLKKPLLCEKPLSKNIDDLYEIRKLIDKGLNLTMMAQYKFLDNPHSIGDSYYSYFRHGSDSLKWDCIQIIGLARGRVTIDGEGSIWKCAINGKKINLGDMDAAYISAVKTWLNKPGDDINGLIRWHQKVMEFQC